MGTNQSAADLYQPGPSLLSSTDAHELIFQVLAGDEIHPSAVKALCLWAQRRDEQADVNADRIAELEDELGRVGRGDSHDSVNSLGMSGLVEVY